MSISSPTTVGTSAGTLTSATSNSPLQITGLASGLNTNAIIQAELAEAELPITNMQTEVSGLQNMDTTLGSIQSALLTVQLDGQALGDPTLFNPTQTVTSSDSSLVDATSTSGIGTPIGGSTVTVTQLATAAQRTFTFTSPASADTVNIDDQQIQLKAGASSQDLADAVNGDANADVWASATSSGQIVFSSRTTGQLGPDYIQVSDTAGSLSEVPADAQDGLDAAYTINGNPGSSPTDTISDSTAGATLTIPGVTLTLNGVTGADTPVTVAAQPPTANTQAITTAVNQFVTDYNTAINLLDNTVGTQPADSATGGTYNPDSGSLFGDIDLENVIGQMRTSIDTPAAGLTAGLSSLSDIGINTGQSTGTVQSSSLSGNLTVNQTQLDAAIQSNPDAVQQIMQSFGTSFFNVLADVAGPAGDLATRVAGNNAEIGSLNNEISNMQAMYAQQEKSMEAEWASVEATLSQLQSQGSAFSASTSSTSSSSSSSSSSST